MTIEVRAIAPGKYEVIVSEGGSESRHQVSVSGQEQATYGGGAAPERLVEESFRFLLEREPKEAILRSFALSTISRYFPEYATEIARRLRSDV